MKNLPIHAMVVSGRKMFRSDDAALAMLRGVTDKELSTFIAAGMPCSWFGATVDEPVANDATWLDFAPGYDLVLTC